MFKSKHYKGNGTLAKNTDNSYYADVCSVITTSNVVETATRGATTRRVVESLQAATTKTHNLLHKTFAMALFILTLFLLFNFRSEAQEFKNFDKRLNEHQKEIVRIVYHKQYHYNTHTRLLSQVTLGVNDIFTYSAMKSKQTMDSIDNSLSRAAQNYIETLYNYDEVEEAFYDFVYALQEFGADTENIIFKNYVEDDTKNKKIFDDNIKKLNDVYIKKFQEFLIDYFKKE